MSTHDFEKQVQQKMDELRFDPSEAVWAEVEKQIRERKRRRLLVWWWTLPFLVAGSIGVYSIYPKKHEKPGSRTGIATVAPGMTDNDVTNNHTTKQQPAANGQKPAANEGKPGDVSAATTASATIPETIAATAPASSHGQQLTAVNGPSTGHAYVVTGHDAVRKGKKNVQTPAMPVAAGDAAVAEPVLPEGDRVVTAEEEKAALKRSWPQAMALPLIAVKPSAEKVFAASAADSAAQKTTHTDRKKKMEWVGTLQAGVSGISTGFSSIPQSTMAYDRSSSLFFSTPGNGVGTGVSQPTVSGSPSSVKPGFAFAAGLSLRRYMSDVFSLEAGLRYSYSSTSIQVGQKRDNLAAAQIGLPTIAGYYTNTAAVTLAGYGYTNQYHFIEIPLRAQLLCGPQSPFSFNAGLSIGRLLASNALQYDASKNVYYKDNGFFNKTQLTLSAGADIRLWRNKAMPLEMGPRLQYGLTNLFKENIYGSRHLLFAGMELRLSFPKK